MGRLTIQVKGVSMCAYVSTEECEAMESCYQCERFKAILSKLAVHEDAEEQGRLVVLPCAVGEKVYYIGTQSYTQQAVFDTTIDDLLYPIVFRTYEFTFAEDDIGKTVFLTREEAKKALK